MTDRFASDTVIAAAPRPRGQRAGLSKAQLTAIVGAAAGLWITVFGLAWIVLA